MERDFNREHSLAVEASGNSMDKGSSLLFNREEVKINRTTESTHDLKEGKPAGLQRECEFIWSMAGCY
jgi:hypothetical protein